MSVQVSAAVMRKIMGKAPKLAVGDRVAGCFSGLCGTITRVYCDCARAKMDDGRSIVQAKRSWVKVK
jgi:preprotein translocase subunit YajC